MQPGERQHLIADLGHADEEVRRLGVERLSLLSESEATPWLLHSLADSSWRVRKAAVERLAALPERAGAVQALLEALADGDNSGRRSAAAEAIVRCGRSAVLALLEALRSTDVDVRKQVVDVLGAIGDPRACHGLQSALADPDANVRAAAADALASLATDEPAIALTACFANDPEPSVRLAALRALVRLEAPLPLSLLVPALSDRVLRNAAYTALGRCSDPGALDFVAKGLLAERATTRAAAGEALLSLVARSEPTRALAIAERVREVAGASPEIVADLCERIDADAPEQRLVAIQLLGILRAKQAVAPLLRTGVDESARDAAAGALRALGEPLVGCLEAHWPRLGAPERSFAAWVVGEAPPGEASERLLLLALCDESLEVRCAAARALARVGTLEALRGLFDRLAVAEAASPGEPYDDEAAACASAVLGVAERGGSEAADAAIELIEARLSAGSKGARLAAARLLTSLARPADATRLHALLTDASPSVR
jgi:HEAT repeat protein